MTLAQFQAMITKYGWDHVLYIIFDNGRTWNCVRPTQDTNGNYTVDVNGKYTYITPTDFITVDTTNEVLILKEPKTGTSYKEGLALTRDVVNPISSIRGINCIPDTVTDAAAIYKYKYSNNLMMNL